MRHSGVAFLREEEEPKEVEEGWREDGAERREEIGGGVGLRLGVVREADIDFERSKL